MAGFLYFIPGAKYAPDKQRLQALQLEHLAEAAFMLTPCSSGPDGRAGLTIAIDPASLPPGAALPRVGYWPERQTWRQCGGFWLGLEKDSPPRPEDLIRPNHKGGHKVTIKNEQEILIPPFRTLPNSWQLNQQGILERVPADEFAELKNVADRIWLDIQNDMDLINAGEIADYQHMSAQEQFNAIAKFITLNYFVGIWEISLLKWLNDETVLESLKAIVDLPALLALLETDSDNHKKKLGTGPDA